MIQPSPITNVRACPASSSEVGYAHKSGPCGQQNNLRKYLPHFLFLSRVLAVGALIRLCSPWRGLGLLFLTLAFPFFTHAQEVYTSQVYQVTLQYPTGWQREESDNERYAGRDGFFLLGAGGSQEETIEEACEFAARHHLRPYGSHPQLERWRVRGQEACLMLPSDDQDKSMEDQAILIVRYPQPVQIGEYAYSYFNLSKRATDQRQ